MNKKTNNINEDRAARYLNALSSRVLVFDGAMGTSIQKCHLGHADFGGEKYDGCNDYLSVTKPEVIEEIHRSYLDVGADVIETNTFRSNRKTLAEYELDNEIDSINMAAAQIAAKLASEYSTPDRPVFVAGSMGPSGKLPSSTEASLNDITWVELVELFRDQAVFLLNAGVDILLLETSQDILEVKAAIEGLKRAIAQTGIKAAIQAQVTLDVTGKMLLGTDIAATLTIIESLDVDVIGLNCSTGPDYMREPVRYLTSHTRLPISVIPNAGLPKNVDGEAVYGLKAEPMSEMLLNMVKEFGCNVIGGCCGTTPEHIKLLVESVKGINPWNNRPAELDLSPRLASAMSAIEMNQVPKPLFIGERVNTQGSKKVKQLLLDDNYDGLLEIANGQVEGGAHTLDICVALTERIDESNQMQKVVKLLSAAIDAPLVIDSTEPEVINAALETCPGRPIVNSINLENGLDKASQVLPLVKTHGAAVIALTIDEEGMAHTSERKLAIAQRIHDIALNDYGLKSEDLIFDVLTFPVTTGQDELKNSAVETLAAIRKVKDALPGVYTVLGLSNVSFGLKQSARRVINSVFLHHVVEAGLDMAIANPNHITPYMDIKEEERRLVDDLLFNKSDDALAEVISCFEEREVETDKEHRIDPTVGMTLNDKIHWYIVHRKKEGIEELVDIAVEDQDPVWVLNHVLLPAMKEVGDKFGTGELILPFVLQSAEVMKKAVSQLEKYLDIKEGVTKGTVVLATVFGDVHDIGKNLVGTILGNNGYTVIDLGKQVPVNTIIDSAIEHNAVAIGLSALLVSTSKQMPICVQELYKRSLEYPVIIGGAAIHRRFGYRTLFVEDGIPYDSGVYYCKDAFEGLEVVDKLISDEKDEFVKDMKIRALNSIEEDIKRAKAKEQEISEEVVIIKSVGKAQSIPTPKKFGSFVIDPSEINIHEIVSYFDLDTLYRLHWGGRGKKGDEWEDLKQGVFEPTLLRYEKELTDTKWLTLGALYGIFEAASDGDKIFLFDNEDKEKIIAEWAFPRQPSGKRLCLSDYFTSINEGRDIIGLQIVTSGPEATKRMEEFQKNEMYSEAYFLNGFANQLSEGLAEFVHRRIKKSMGLADGQGLRYSWGYPACPDLGQHVDVLKILDAQRIGVTLTESFQLVPEQSTAALVVHHPEAVYFSTGIEKREREKELIAEMEKSELGSN